MDEVIEAMGKARFAVLPMPDGNGEALTLSDLIAGAIEPASVEAMQAQMDEAVRIIMTAAYNAMRAKLVPVMYAVEEEGHPIISYITREKPTEQATSVTPLYALPEIDNG